MAQTLILGLGSLARARVCDSIEALPGSEHVLLKAVAICLGKLLSKALVHGNNNGITKGVTMSVRKTAIAIPEELLVEVDRAAEARGESRSRYISCVLRAAVKARRDAAITQRLNELFADERIILEQSRTARELDDTGTDWANENW